MRPVNNMEKDPNLTASATDAPSASVASPAASAPARVVRVASLNLVTGGLLAFGVITLLVVYFNNLWTKEYYQFYPLALAATGFLVWTGLKEVPRPWAAGAGWFTAACLGLAFLILTAATLLWSGWMGAIGTFVLALGVVWWLGGWPLTRALLPAAFMALTVLRPPMDLDGRLTMKLQALATQWSSVALDGLGVTHALSGNVIEIPKHRLMVEEACSGINSILSTTAVCLFFCLWQRRKVLHILAMLAMTVGFVLLGNVTRIVSGAWLRYKFDVDILVGWKHETIGLVLFACYLGLILSADQLLLFVFGRGLGPAPDRLPGRVGEQKAAAAAAAAAATAPEPKVEIRRGSSWPAWAAGVLFALLGLTQVAMGTMELKSWVKGRSIDTRVIANLSLPNELAGWRLLETGSGDGPNKVEMNGVHSQAWHFRRGSETATVALDYPFKGYHDVTICYTGNGWEVYAKRTRQASESQDGVPCVEVRMQKTMGARAALWFSTLDQKGNWVDGSYVGRTLAERFREKTSSTTYRVQLLTTSYLPLTPESEESMATLFREARTLLAQQLMADLRSK